MPYIAQEKIDPTLRNTLDGDYRSYGEAKADVLSDVSQSWRAPNLTGIFTTCYTEEYDSSQIDKSKPNGDYADSSDIFQTAVDLSDIDPSAPVSMTGQLELGPGETYTCFWGYLDTSGGDYITDQGSVVNLADLKKTQGTDEGKVWNAFKDEYPEIRQDYQLKKKDDDEAKYSNTASNWNWRPN